MNKPCRICSYNVPCPYNHDQRTPDEIRKAQPIPVTDTYHGAGSAGIAVIRTTLAELKSTTKTSE